MSLNDHNHVHSLKALPLEERPRERLQKFGSHSISTLELIAILLGSGTRGKSALHLAQEILSRFGNLTQLSEATLEELCQIKGLGLVKASKLKAAFSLSSRLAFSKLPLRYKIEKPSDAYIFIKDHLENQSKEILITILMDAKGFLINWEMVSMGTLTQVLVHPREVFYSAIRNKAASLIIVHNHPSGDQTPSSQDFNITKTLYESGQLLNIPLNDHLIIGKKGYYSFRERGFLPLK